MIGTNLGAILVIIYAGLLLFGLGYNALVSWLESHKYQEGYTSDLVAVGCAVTIAPFICLPSIYPAWQVVAMIAGGFIASGSPMMIGARIRHAKARKHDQAALLAE